MRRRPRWLRIRKRAVLLVYAALPTASHAVSAERQEALSRWKGGRGRSVAR